MSCQLLLGISNILGNNHWPIWRRGASKCDLKTCFPNRLEDGKCIFVERNVMQKSTPSIPCLKCLEEPALHQCNQCNKCDVKLQQIESVWLCFHNSKLHFRDGLTNSLIITPYIVPFPKFVIEEYSSQLQSKRGSCGH